MSALSSDIARRREGIAEAQARGPWQEVAKRVHGFRVWGLWGLGFMGLRV